MDEPIFHLEADMATELRAARLLTEDAARKRGAHGRYSLEASMAKLFASEAAGRIADRQEVNANQPARPLRDEQFSDRRGRDCHAGLRPPD